MLGGPALISTSPGDRHSVAEPSTEPHVTRSLGYAEAAGAAAIDPATAAATIDGMQRGFLPNAALLCEVARSRVSH
jgi:hypothetical protein